MVTKRSVLVAGDRDGGAKTLNPPSGRRARNVTKRLDMPQPPHGRPRAGPRRPKLSLTYSPLPPRVPFLLTRHRYGTLITIRESLTYAEAVDACLRRMQPKLLDFVVDSLGLGDPRIPGSFHPSWDLDTKMDWDFIHRLEAAGRLLPWPHRS